MIKIPLSHKKPNKIDITYWNRKSRTAEREGEGDGDGDGDGDGGKNGESQNIF